MFDLMSKLTSTRVPSIAGIRYHFTVLLLPVDVKSYLTLRARVLNWLQQTALRV